MAELVDGPLDVAGMVAAATRADCGAHAIFVGTTRDHHEGRRVERLWYEAYRPMALAALEKLERDVRERYDVADCRIAHRLGEVPPGEASVVVIVTAPHRRPAFDACRWAMDELKSGVPIWKKESYAGGASAWAPGKRLE